MSNDLPLDTLATTDVRELLLQMRNRHRERLDHRDEVVPGSWCGDDADRAENAIEIELTDLVGERDLRGLELVERALERLDRGEWGSCESCGQQIHEERLTAFPQAIRCISCA